MSAAADKAYLSEIFASFQGEGSRVGQRHLFVRFAGCNIRCRWCDTPASLVRTPACSVDYPGGEHTQLDNPVSWKDLAAIIDRCCKEDPTIAMIAITGGEPMVQSAFLSHWLSCAPPPVPCLLETNAMLVHGLSSVLPRIALVSADVKLPSNSGEGELWDRHRAFLEGCRGTELYVKMPVDAATDAAEVERAARLVAECAPEATLFVQPITAPDTPQWQIDSARLAELAAVAATVVADTRVLPQMHKLVGVR
ncbi:MAG TPA: 7-carboxy-7-deazaguanine synthase QueE [Candidatus Limnocylindrales bacterium]|nr:7-carboxy-7-deazaguanine synthase QueE [Candidatus Limnocylindrales bacterium]